MAVVEKLAPDVFDLPANVLPVAIVGHTISTIGVNIEAQKIETIKVDIVAQTIDKIAIDIAAQSLSQVDVNIAAQAVTVNVKTPTGEHVDADIVSSITLDINLTGSTITLPVNIAAQAVELAVDITSQTLANVNMKINAQAVGVYIQKEWAVKEAEEVDSTGSAIISPGVESAIAAHAVPAGMAHYVDFLEIGIKEEKALVFFYLKGSIRGIVLQGACVAGIFYPFPRPIRFIGGELITLTVMHYGTKNLAVYGGFHGREE